LNSDTDSGFLLVTAPSGFCVISSAPDGVTDSALSSPRKHEDLEHTVAETSLLKIAADYTQEHVESLDAEIGVRVLKISVSL
jgi:hypothetical protein